MRKFDRSFEVSLFDGIGQTGVYVGTLTNLKNITDDLDWREGSETNIIGEHYKVLTLGEIEDQVDNKKLGYLITVIHEEPLSGFILQVGNYSDLNWWKVGDLIGYA